MERMLKETVSSGGEVTLQTPAVPYTVVSSKLLVPFYWGRFRHCKPKGRRGPNQYSAKQKCPFSLLPSSGLHLHHVQLHTTATPLKSGPDTGPAASMSLPCQQLPFCPCGCVCSQRTAVKVLIPPWWEQQGWALGVSAADQKVVHFPTRFFPVGKDQAVSQTLWRQCHKVCSGKAKAL